MFEPFCKFAAPCLKTHLSVCEIWNEWESHRDASREAAGSCDYTVLLMWKWRETYFKSCKCKIKCTKWDSYENAEDQTAM